MSGKSFSIVNIPLEALSEPATKLIETVADAVGVLYEPTRIRRKAEAEVEAAKIRLEGSIELQQIALHSSNRLNNLEARRQRIIESIVDKAIQQLPDHVSDEEVDEDWVFQFFNYCQDVSNEQMQELWACLLAGEVAEPGSYSLRTLNIVRMLRQDDATLFELMSNYVWNGLYVFHNEEMDELLKSRGLYPVRFLHLQFLGLLIPATLLGITLGKGDMYETEYFGKVHRLTYRKGPKERLLFAYTLTDSGQELLSLCNSEPDEEYRTALVKSWSDAGIEVEISESKPGGFPSPSI